MLLRTFLFAILPWCVIGAGTRIADNFFFPGFWWAKVTLQFGLYRPLLVEHVTKRRKASVTTVGWWASLQNTRIKTKAAKLMEMIHSSVIDHCLSYVRMDSFPAVIKRCRHGENMKKCPGLACCDLCESLVRVLWGLLIISCWCKNINILKRFQDQKLIIAIWKWSECAWMFYSYLPSLCITPTVQSGER